ncbi:hypothetical protein P4U99_21305 [Brevibacillus agri]|uniref:hypothetical protein n=1 Tax=Brevibacillus agri TaxID=51101 RepID=UPI002E1CAD73|nr:hypothetical protein [Brevibacillus agri]MED1687012.1 hypothetical protein [Brevibacillus agri]MED1703065.1 hypothetical protein [Brevibacillus agri]MED1728814.1 hypothetical protein [Brevibacillus agri]
MWPTAACAFCSKPRQPFFQDDELPSAPKLRNAFGHVRIAEVFHKVKAEHFPQSARHVRVAAEVKVKLEGKCHNAEPGEKSRQLVGRRRFHVGPQQPDVIGEQHFFRQSSDQQRRPFAEWPDCRHAGDELPRDIADSLPRFLETTRNAILAYLKSVQGRDQDQMQNESTRRKKCIKTTRQKKAQKRVLRLNAIRFSEAGKKARRLLPYCTRRTARHAIFFLQIASSRPVPPVERWRDGSPR